jgi:hypothetical protein
LWLAFYNPDTPSAVASDFEPIAPEDTRLVGRSTEEKDYHQSEQ